MTFRDNYRLYQQGRSNESSLSCDVTMTTGMELFKEENVMDSVLTACSGFAEKLSPQSWLARCLCLMVYSCTNEISNLDVDMTTVPLVFGPLSSFIDRDDQVDLELACLSNMSITVIFVPNINIHPGIFNFVSDLFDMDKKEIQGDKLKHAIFAVHGPIIADKTHLVNVLSSGFVNFIQDYDIMNGSIFGSERDDKGECTSHELHTNFPEVGTLGTFLTKVQMLTVSCVLKVADPSLKTPYFQPVRKLLTEYLMNRSPATGFTWLNGYLEKIRAKIFSMDNLIHTFVTPEGNQSHGLYISSMLDNIFKFGGKHERYRYHRMWARSNCCIETVCASAMVIYKHATSGKYRLFGVSAVERMFTVLPLDNTTHCMISWLPSHMSQSLIE